MTTTWVMVASASEANLYANRGPNGGLEPVEQYQHTESRERDQDLVSDRPGHYQTEGGAHGTFSQETDPKQHEEDKFAVQLAHALETGRVEHHCTRIILVAPAAFMGRLNGHLSKAVNALVSDRIEKDYVRLPVKELSGHLERILYV